jgi:hypothetical protein
MNNCNNSRIFKKTDKAYNFLIDKEKKNEAFSISELAISVGWKEESVITYLSKKWRPYIDKDKNNMSIEFIKQEGLTEEELKEYENAIVLIKNKSNPYKLKPNKVTELVQKKINQFKIHIHTRCWKYYNARPQNNNSNYKSEYCGWVEGFDGYLYTESWVNFLIKKLSNEIEFKKVEKYR